ncbi:MAG: S8 family serine peptidase [Oscillospiraceae bacterium]|nr:S8 family serine peptidase [Oscillospiraceae bacterium]
MRETKLNRIVLLPLLLAAFLTAGLVHAPPGGEAGTDYIVKLREEAAWLGSGGPFEVVSEGEMRLLRAAGLLQWYEPDGEMTLLEGETSAYYSGGKWDLALINADPAFEMEALGRGVRVGILDSGINEVEFLAGKVLPGRSYMEDESETDTADRYGHGTLVAALIAGESPEGYLGAAPGAELVPLKITDGKVITVSAVCRAIYGGIDDFGCQILNLSLGVTSDFNSLREAVDYAAEKGVVIVAAVGNSGRTGKMYPAEYESVIGVGSVDENGEISSRSNHNDSVFITAPGVNVRTAGRNGGYITTSGTSFAVPHVTAAAAVMLGLNPDLTPEEIAETLAETARDAGDEGWDEYYGYGILDLGACARQVGGEADSGGPETPCSFLSSTVIANYTDRDITCTYLLAEYDPDGTCISVTARLLTVPAGDIVRVEQPQAANYGQFIYETDTMKPLAPARKSQ